jgi:LysR family D-serine deaminase transcriptional activator
MLVEQSMLALLHTFEVSARHLSFTKAAEELFLTQGAISQRIRRLEELLKFKLFIRLTRKLVLTPEGEQLLQALTSSLQQINEVIEDIRFNELRGMLCIGLPPAFGQLWLMPRLTSFKTLYRSLDLLFYGQHGLPNFETEPVDMAVYYGNASLPHLHSWPLLEEWLVPVCSPEYAASHFRNQLPSNSDDCLADEAVWQSLSGKDKMDLRKCSLLHCTESLEQFDFGYEWQHWSQATGVALPHTNRKYVFNQHAMALEAAKHGMGLAMGRWYLAMPAVLRGELVIPVDYKIPSGMGYQLFCSREHVQRPCYQAFAQWLQRTIDEWQEIKEASLSAAHPFISSDH